MKPQEQLELQAILNAERSLRDARSLMGRGKRTLTKRIALLRDARDILDSHLTLQPVPAKSDQPELLDQPPQSEAQ